MVLASGGQDGAICLWDVLTGSRVSHVYGHRGDVTSLVCTTSCVISSGLDDLICIWDRSTGIKLYSIQQVQMRLILEFWNTQITSEHPADASSLFTLCFIFFWSFNANNFIFLSPGSFHTWKNKSPKILFFGRTSQMAGKIFFFPTNIFFRLTHDKTFFFYKSILKKLKNSQNILVFFPLIFTQKNIQCSFHALNLKTFSPSFFTQGKKKKFLNCVLLKKYLLPAKHFLKKSLFHTWKPFVFPKDFQRDFFQRECFFSLSLTWKKIILKKFSVLLSCVLLEKCSILAELF